MNTRLKWSVLKRVFLLMLSMACVVYSVDLRCLPLLCAVREGSEMRNSAKSICIGVLTAGVF